jgi:hypothetical protein
MISNSSASSYQPATSTDYLGFFCAEVRRSETRSSDISFLVVVISTPKCFDSGCGSVFGDVLLEKGTGTELLSDGRGHHCFYVVVVNVKVISKN